jgi:acetate kinase
LGGLDVLVFTGGIGEHAAPVRAKVGAYARWLGVRLDDDANKGGQAKLTGGRSTPAVFVIPTNEDLMIARHTLRVLRGTPVAEAPEAKVRTAAH